MASPIHFYMTFNPLKNDYVEPGYTQAHEFFDYLVSEIKKNPKSYAYWGKIIGDFRESTLDIETFKKVINDNKEFGCSTHLYISDFQNLWVGKVEDVIKNIKTDFRTLPFYKDKKVEAWFKISDFTLLEATSERTAKKLTELYIDNDYMDLEIDEMSPFTTAIKYPAFIQDLAEEHYFDELDEDEISHLALQFNPGIENNGHYRVIHSIQTMSIPEQIYSKMPHSAHNEIETAELDMLEHRHHNLNKVAFSYIKSVEIILNDLVIHHLKREGYGEAFFVQANVMPPKLFLEDRGDAGIIPISKFQKNYSINQLIHFVRTGMRSNNFGFRKAFERKKDFLKYVTGEFADVVEKNQLLQIRGLLAHSDSNVVDENDALAVRALSLGIGCKGIIHSLYQSFYGSELTTSPSVKGKYVQRQRSNPVKVNQKKAA